MDKISAVIITKNEEHNIGRCLDSLQGIADEIIVVDSFSTDNTKTICAEYKVNFVEKEFIDYSSSKNHGNDLAQYPFILSLDADEALSEELKTSILASNLTEDGYYFNRRTNYCGKWIYHCGWYPDSKLRLFRKSKAKWVGEVHETLSMPFREAKYLKGDLLHYSYNSISSHIAKINSFTDMQAKGLFDNGKKASTLKLIVAPLFELFKKLILKRGLLDGYYGFVISMMSAYYKFCKYAKLKDLWTKELAQSTKT